MAVSLFWVIPDISGHLLAYEIDCKRVLGALKLNRKFITGVPPFLNFSQYTNIDLIRL
jgi:hypothetical protein